MNISEKLKLLASFFDRPIYLVGGYVRNYIMGSESGDIDIASEYLPEEVEEKLKNTAFTVSAEFAKLGTLLIKNGDEEYEYTTFRTDSYDTAKSHTPTEVKFTDNIMLDAQRRDFTINAIYYDIKNGSTVDVLNGIDDIKNKVLKTTRKAELVFDEDPLRILRLFRFSAQLGLKIEEQTYKASCEKVDNLAVIKPERIRKELEGIMLADKKYPKFSEKFAHYQGMRLLIDSGAIKYIIPELLEGKDIEQNKKYHKYDVLTHTLEVFKNAEPEIRLAGLLHDIAKPRCLLRDNNVYKHSEEGEKMTFEIMTRLFYPNKEIVKIASAVKEHNFAIDSIPRIRKIRLWISKNIENIDYILKLKRADYLGKGIDEASPRNYEILDEVYQEMLDSECAFRLKDLETNGNDMLALGITGKNIKEVLQKLLEEMVATLTKPDKETELNIAKSIIKGIKQTQTKKEVRKHKY